MSLLLLFRSEATASSAADFWALLHDWYESDETIHLAGGFWADSAPDRTPLPYAVERTPHEEIAESLGQHLSDMATLQISIFATNRDQLATLRTAWVASLRRFRKNKLATHFEEGAGWDRLELSRIRRRRDPDPGPNGEDVWIMDLEYDVDLSEDLN